MVEAFVNPDLISPEKEDLRREKRVEGERIRVDYMEDGKDAFISRHTLYYPDSATSSFYSALNSSIVSTRVCNVMESHCPSVFAANGFDRLDDCVIAMESLPLVTKNDAGLTVVDGNSTGCRHLHASLAVTFPETHCPHVSFFPMEDPAGATKCHKSSNYAFEDDFTVDDFSLFDHVASRAGLDSTHHTTMFFPYSATDKPVCSEIPVSNEGLSAALQLPSDSFCTFYLENQNANNASNNTAYWLVLVGMWCCFRGLSIWSLKRKGTL